MARPLRIEFPGGVYHVTSRGDGREDIYLSDADRVLWLEIFADVCNRFNWVCHAYCLMNNHYHVVIETPDANLSKGMRQLNGVYTQKFNRHHGRIGHVFQGRYKAILVDKNAYLLELGRYVVLNPVRANMVKSVAEWPWSSYCACTGDAIKPAWLQTDWLLSQFGNSPRSAIDAYKSFVAAGVGKAGIWNQLQGQIYLGDETFVHKMQSLVNQELRLTEVPRLQTRPPAKKLKAYQAQNIDQPDVGMALAYLSGSYTMQAIAEVFDVHYATVSRAVRKFEQR